MKKGLPENLIEALSEQVNFQNYVLLNKLYFEKNIKDLTVEQLVWVQTNLTNLIVSKMDYRIRESRHNHCTAETLASLGLMNTNLPPEHPLINNAFEFLGRLRQYFCNWEWFEKKYNRKIVPTKSRTCFDNEK